MGRRCNMANSMKTMATPVIETQWKCSLLTFYSNLTAQIQPILEEEEFDEEENVECNNV